MRFYGPLRRVLRVFRRGSARDRHFIRFIDATHDLVDREEIEEAYQYIAAYREMLDSRAAQEGDKNAEKNGKSDRDERRGKVQGY